MINNSKTNILGEDPQFKEFEQMSPQSRSYFLRTFGKIGPGALRGAILTLMSSAIGAGCLTLPLVFYRQGIILGFITLVLAGLCSYKGVVNISKAAENFKIYEYSKLVEKVLGNKWKILFDVCIVLYAYGVVIGLQVMIGYFVPSIFLSININLNPDYARILIMCSACIFIMIPLSLLRTLTSLRFGSLLSALTITYISLLIICQFPFFAEHISYSHTKIFDMNLNIINSFNICLYSFTCHTNVAPVYDELQRRNLRRMSKVAKRSTIFTFIPFLILCLFGYLSTLNDTPNLIIMRKAPSHISNDWMMVLARFLMSISLVISVPINLFSGRNIVIRNFLKIKDEVPSKKIHCSVVIISLLATLIVAIFYPNILVLFSLMGGFCCGVFVLVIPSKVYSGFLIVKTEGWGDRSCKALFYKTGSILIAVIGTSGAILNAFGVI